jgi:hypothetical protein
LLSRIRPIEALLTEAVQRWGPILAFSEPVEHLPSREMLRHDYVPGYATLPEDGWFEKFADIARVSAGIIIFPSATESIIRELQWIICNGHLDKAVFVMSPEELSPVQSFSFIVFFKHFLPKQVTDPIDDDIKRQSEFWEDARKECAAFGIALPPYNPLGLLFAYSNGGSLKVIKMFDQNKDATFKIPGRMFLLRTTIKTLLLGRIPASGPKQWESNK